MTDYNKVPNQEVVTQNRTIAVFNSQGGNIDEGVVQSFGEEWKKFYNFDEDDIEKVGSEYFDIINDTILNKNSYVMDVGCGTGRWTKYLQNKVKFIEAIDPSNAIFYADKLLKGTDNIRLSKASTDTIPFDDNTFDFVMSIGVLHHIPNTQKAMDDCVKKLKIGGYFYVYLYYNLEQRGIIFKSIFWVSNLVRKIISSLPSGLKKVVCDLLAIILYMPLIILGSIFKKIGLTTIATLLPLSYYQDKSFFIVRNDALDRFGTSLEQRFSRSDIKKMMENSGLSNIVISENEPYWHSVGERIK
jgi:SAM-dependent methyltransferase